MTDVFAITFTKDRAPQLELLLQSIEDNMEPGLITEHWIVLKSTDETNIAAYKKLQAMSVGKNVKWLIETHSFHKTMETLVQYFYRKNPEGYLMFFTDDDVVYNPTGNVSQALKEFDPQKHLGLSLRHDSKYKHDYVKDDSLYSAPVWTRGEEIPPVWTRVGEGFVEWDWTTAKYSPWNYPFSVEGQIYTIKGMRELIVSGIYKAPNTLESMGANMLRGQVGNPGFKQRLYLGTPKASVFGNAINKTQTEWETPHGKVLTTERLTAMYLDGYILDPKQFYKLPVSDVHCVFEDECLLVKR